MKQYSYTEIASAQQQLGRPVNDFLGSDAIAAIIEGIRTKLGLDSRQNSLVVDVITATLVKLEPESALETNIHQIIPELSNEKTAELVADIRDRIFKEAKRREEHNVTEPRYDWDEREHGPRPTPELIEKRRVSERWPEHYMSDEALQKLAKEKIILLEEREDREDAEYAAAQKARGLPTPEESLAADEAAAASEGESLSVEAAPAPATTVPATPTTMLATPELTTPALNTQPKPLPIATQKLAAPTIQQTGQAQIETGLGRSGISSVPVPDPSAANTRTAEKPSEKMTPLQKTDLYREPLD